MEENIKKIKKLIADKAGLEISDIDVTDYFEDDLNIGEMELLEILEELEEAFHVELMESKDEIETVEDLIDLIAEQVD